MKLKDVTHTECFCGKETTDKFNIHNNRFVLFDKYGNRINEFSVEDIPDYLDLDVLEVKRSSYFSATYFVGFPTTHIKLDYFDPKIIISFRTEKFGQTFEDRGY